MPVNPKTRKVREPDTALVRVGKRDLERLRKLTPDHKSDRSRFRAAFKALWFQKMNEGAEQQRLDEQREAEVIKSRLDSLLENR